jgi:lipoic acid synthetase
VTPEEFEEYQRIGEAKGFQMVASSPLTRSSYHADRDFEEFRRARQAALAQA